MTLAAYFHDLDPVIFRLSGEWAVRWYGLSYTVGFIIAWALWMWLARRGASRIRPQRVTDAMLLVVLGTLLGGRVGYAVVYDPDLLTGFSASFPFWDMLAINKGGMASHGAMVGLVTAAWLVARGPRDPGVNASPSARPLRVPTLHVMDILCLLSPPGILLGRLANFVNGELLGKIVAPPGAPAPWWSVRFPQELLGWVEPGVRKVHSHTPDLSPAQLDALGALVRANQAPGQRWNDALHAIVARAGEHRAALEPLLSARHPSQIYQAVAEGLVVGVVAWFVARLPRKPGVVAAWWLIVYGVLRVATEFWRLPDAQFDEGRPLGLSRGQWLSVGMVGVGVGLLVFALRRAGPVMGGWLKPAVAQPTPAHTSEARA